MNLIDEVLGPISSEDIDRILKTLAPREERVLMARMEGQTLREIAHSYACTPERIRQIQIKAIRKLRNPMRIGIVQRVAGRYKEPVTELKLVRKLYREVPEGMEEFNVPSSVLQQGIDALPLSTRSYNGLMNGGVKNLYELCLKTEKQLLENKNLGKKSLAEINELLSSMGLSLAVSELPPPAKAGYIWKENA